MDHPADDLESERRTLRAAFGFDDFLAHQGEVVCAALAGEDLFVVWPTGGGKSLIYQYPALTRPGLCVVVSPLIALMRDQVKKLRAKNLAAGALHLGQDPDEARAVREKLGKGALRLLYVSPERLAEPEARAQLREAGVRLLAVDEAHCISQWGHDFRPDYSRIHEAAAELGDPQLMAVTATAGPRVRAEIVEKLFVGRQPRVMVGSFRRPAIRLCAQACEGNPTRRVVALARERVGRSGIVYCRTRAETESIAQALAEAGLEAAAYHAGLAPAEREAREAAFVGGGASVMAATIAFGLGVDKPDVRYIIHAGLPDHLETLYQESGRAGRDGQAAEAMVLFDPRRLEMLRRAQPEIARIDPPSGAAAAALVHYFETIQCREQALLASLGEICPPCGQCDNCLRGFKRLRGVAQALRGVPRAAGAHLRLMAERVLAPRASPASQESEASGLGFEPAFSDEAGPPLTVAQTRRLLRLTEARRTLARKLGVTPTRLIGDAALARAAIDPPADLATLIAQTGDETGLLARYGAALVERAGCDVI